MERVLIVRYGELAVKSARTRRRMTRILVDNIERGLRRCGKVVVQSIPGRIIVRGLPDPECGVKAASRIFGVKSVSPAIEATFESLEDIVAIASKLWSEVVSGRRFAVEVNRVGLHNFTSIDVKRAVGDALRKYGAVNLEDPDVRLYIEIRGWRAYFFDRVIKGPGGLPLGAQRGKVLALVSGGIDSPVAAWMMMRRGAYVDVMYCNLGGPYLEAQALRVVERLLASWSVGYDAKVYVVDCEPLADAIRTRVDPHLRPIAFRRGLYRIASALAKRIGALALVTGESLGQVSSQTLHNLCNVEYGIDLPIYRPLIGLDKDDIVNLAKCVGTYELSIEVPEYCAIFSSKPRTVTTLDDIKQIDQALANLPETLLERVRVYNLGELSKHIKLIELTSSDLRTSSVPEGAILVDLRDPESYKREHIDGAVNINVGSLQELIERFGRNRTYVFYCYSGGLALDAAHKLRSYGVKAYALKPNVLKKQTTTCESRGGSEEGTRRS